MFARRAFFLPLLTLGLAACGREAIVREGRGAAVILLPAGADPDLALAAEEIRTYAKRVSGADLAIESASGAPKARVRIFLEAPAPNGERPQGVEHPDGYRLESHGRLVRIRGGSARGTLYGAYDFIERAFGVRWFMPTALGEDVVPASTIEVPELDLVHNPGFAFIDGFAWKPHPGIGEWVRRVRARAGVDGVFGHNWENILPLTPENLRKHPGAFAEVDGRRGVSRQLCTTDPDVIAASVDAARRWFDTHPRSPVFSVSPNDGDGFCDCARCRKLDRENGVSDGGMADRLVVYANAVLSELGKTHPGRQVGVLAYGRALKPPRRVKPQAEFATMVTHTPWEFCHAHALSDPGCARNRVYLEALRGWTALTPHSGVYEYYGHFLTATPWPIVHSMRRDIPLFHEMRLERFVSETQAHWATQGVGFYVAAKLADDPRTDVDALLAEYFERFYGPAAAPMRRYFDLFERAMQETASREEGGFGWMSLFTPALIETARREIDAAEAATREAPEKFRSRVAFARLGFAYTDAFTRMRDAGERRDVRAVLEWSQVAEDRLRATSGSAPQAFDIPLALDATRYWTRRALEGGKALTTP